MVLAVSEDQNGIGIAMKLSKHIKCGVQQSVYYLLCPCFISRPLQYRTVLLHKGNECKV